MKPLFIVLLLLCLPIVALAQQKENKLFPYKYTIDDLPNGLRLVTVPTDYPNLVALYIVVQTGSRNEIEAGKSGYAHFFEHMMFRGSENYTPEQRDAILKRAGAESNAYTSSDRTVYYETFSKEDLDEVMKLEADRFQRLKYGQDVYKTESLAVLGEYNKNSAAPTSKLYETLRATAFNKHTYAHTTMGFLEDIKDMPNQYDYSLEFYKRFYRPEYTTILIVGDVTQARALDLTKKYFGDWKRGDYVPAIPSEPKQTEARTAAVDWPTPTLPWLTVAFRGPAYSDEKKDKAALDLLAPLAFGPNSELYQRLVLKEQKVDNMYPSFANQMDPELFSVYARVKDPKDVEYVRDQILATYKRFTEEMVDQAKLDATRSRMRYAVALSMDSSTAIASALAPFISLRRTPETMNKLFALYQQIVEAMYPMASSVGWQIDKEMTVFTGTTHVENLDRYYSLLRDMLMEPGFREDDFKRLRDDAVNFLKVSLRQGNDEELGKEYLYNLIYAGHPYAHHNMGRIGSLEKLTLDDVREFYRNNYTRANLVLGMAGGYNQDFAKRVEADFAKLPEGKPNQKRFEMPKVDPGTRIEIVDRDTRSTAFSLGFPIEATRASKDWPALAVVASYLGQHRSSNSYLYQQLREARGLNYGDYAYIEYFPRGMFQFTPDPNLGRSSQIFQIWIRPVEPQNGLFTLRATLYEYDKLVREGISKEAFEATRVFLMKYSNILTDTQNARLGYALDSRYYGIGDFNQYMRDQLAKLTLEDVNRAIQRHLKSDRMRVVVITKGAEAFRNAIIKGDPSPMTYNSPKPKQIMDEDKVIQTYKIMVKPEDIRVVPIERVFE